MAGLREKLQATLPPDIQVQSIEQVDERSPTLQTQVLSAEYEIQGIDSDFGLELNRKIESVMTANSIIRTRREKQYDLRALIEAVSLMDGKIFMRLAAREGATGRPEEVLDELGIQFDETRIERTRLIFKT